MTADDFKRLAKKLSTALVDLTPGGSEYFTLVGDDYYADIDACVRVIRESKARTLQFAGERNVQRQRAEAAEAAVAEARKLMDEAQQLLQLASHAHQKMRLEGEGRNIGHSHEVRMFALHFSNAENPPPPDPVMPTGSGRFWNWWQAANAWLLAHPDTTRPT